MKTNDILLLGGAVLAYLFLKPQAPVSQVPQVVQPIGQGLGTGAGLLSTATVTPLLTGLAKLFSPAGATPAAQTAADNAAVTQAQQQLAQTIAAGPVAYTPSADVTSLTPSVIDQGYTASYGSDLADSGSLDMGTISAING